MRGERGRSLPQSTLPLTVPPESSPSGGAFFFKPSTEIKPTWCCLVVFQASYEGNQLENVVLFSDIPLERSVRFLGGMREGMGKGKGKERRTKPTCVHPSFLTSPLKRKLQPPTNKQPTTNQHPTNITNQHPTWWTALRWIAQHFALSLLPLLIRFFPV